jgi:hypothetical protein
LQRRASGNQGQGEKMDATLEAQDQAAIARHVEWLKQEPAAVSLNATLPSGLAVVVHKDGRVEHAEVVAIDLGHPQCYSGERLPS